MTTNHVPLTKEVGGAYARVIGSTVLLCGLIFGAWEAYEYHLAGEGEWGLLRTSYILRGALASLFLAAWSAFLVRRFSRKMQLDHAAVERAVSRAERMSVIGYFAAEVAHEVGNPLSAISSLVQTLREEEKDPTRAGKLDVLTYQIDRLKRTVDRIKGSVRGEKSIESIVLHPLVQDSILLLRFDGHVSRKVNLAVAALPSDFRVKADRWAVIQILINLILNAMEAMGEKGGDIHVSARRRGDKIELQVRDNGPGIPEEVKGKLFQLFTTSKPQGTGIGLFVCRRLALAMGGDLTAENHSGGGADLTLTLPEASA